MKALIGHTGFVGSNILRQAHFDSCYNSDNIPFIENRKFNLVVCSGISSVKWYANKYPDEDMKSIQRLMKHLCTIECDQFVLLSTIDVYDRLNGVYEDDVIDVDRCDSYGRNRLYFENFIREQFCSYILRLPTLFGRNLKKNSIYDLFCNNYSYLPDVRSKFQYYSLDCIWGDIKKCLENDIRTLNICSEPTEFSSVIKMFNISTDIFGTIRNEDMRTKHSKIWGSQTDYLYTQEYMLNKLTQFIRDYQFYSLN